MSLMVVDGGVGEKTADLARHNIRWAADGGERVEIWAEQIFFFPWAVGLSSDRPGCGQ
jgi:hypothetical protein